MSILVFVRVLEKALNAKNPEKVLRKYYSNWARCRSADVFSDTMNGIQTQKILTKRDCEFIRKTISTRIKCSRKILDKLESEAMK